jgi:L-threonylcarbamoyladenylate synthase
MFTEVIPVDPASPQPDVIARAAAVLRSGGLVAFPTETVYGLGANALDAEAVARIFTAKGRPANNPLIVHVPDASAVPRVAAAWPESATRLAGHFWPGPLTFVLPKRGEVPDAVTAGGPTVAVRVPANAVALALLRAAGVPVAAPSANRSSELSPTRAEHVLRGLGGRVDLILDGGMTSGGIESTVLDVTSSPPRLLRPGLIGPAALEAVIGPLARTIAPANAPGAALASPGLLPRHYAPRTQLYCEETGAREKLEALSRGGHRVGWVPFTSQPDAALPGAVVRQLPKDPAGYAAKLYDTLHELDGSDLDAIVVELPPATDEWLAVRDRLRRGTVADNSPVSNRSPPR